MQDNILTHDIENEDQSVLIKRLKHKNHYDFTQLHRHNYFELLMFEVGGGTNLIDFTEYEVRSSSCHIVFPDQVHLLNRAPGSKGYVVQFKTSLIDPSLIELLQERLWWGEGSVVFEENEVFFSRFKQFLDLALSLSNTAYTNQSLIHLLQALLYELVIGNRKNSSSPFVANNDFHSFQKLIEYNFKEQHKVSFYIQQLQINEKKLTQLTKKHSGNTPLYYIHNRILLEAKRLLAFEKISLKEMAYQLGFDSPPAFSAFIKKKTGHSPSELQVQLTEIHKCNA